jgi:hypothetical protein
MCTHCDDPSHIERASAHARRTILKAGVGLASASLLAGVATSAHAAPKGGRAPEGPLPTKALGIKADVELVRAQDINRAYERIVNKDVRYRHVIDMASLKTA